MFCGLVDMCKCDLQSNLYQKAVEIIDCNNN